MCADRLPARLAKRRRLCYASGMGNGQTADLILAAGGQLIAQAGPEGASVRAIAERAGIPPPTLQHHFRSKARLLEAIYAQAVASHLAGSAAVLSALAPGGEGGEPDSVRRAVRRDITVALAAEWLREGAAAIHTAVVLHLLVQAVRDPAYAALAERWAAETAAALVHAARLEPDEALFLVELLVGLVLVSGPALFRRESDVLNRELVSLACRVEEAGAGYWLAHFRALRGKRPGKGPAEVERQGGVPADILHAGVTLTAETGADALSYRKIAARAQVAPSSVLYHFPDRRALLTALYRAVHQRFMAAEPLTQMAQWPHFSASGPHGRMADVFTYMIVEQRVGDVPLFLASCELFLMGWREPDLASDALAMRLERGAPDGRISADRQEALTAHLQSLWSIGVALTQFARPSADRVADVGRRLRAGMRIMTGEG